MNNKVMIKAIIPSVDKEYDIKIPVNVETLEIIKSRIDLSKAKTI